MAPIHQLFDAIPYISRIQEDHMGYEDLKDMGRAVDAFVDAPVVNVQIQIIR